MTTERREADLLRGVLDMCVLATLEMEPTHAYDVVERLRTRGFATVGYGTIYPLVTRLRSQGLLAQESRPSPGGPRRQVLSVTSGGRAALVDWRGRWEQSASAVAHVLSELDRAGVDRG